MNFDILAGTSCRHTDTIPLSMFCLQLKHKTQICWWGHNLRFCLCVLVKDEMQPQIKLTMVSWDSIYYLYSNLCLPFCFPLFQPRSPGKVLFDLVCDHLNLTEGDYFGLEYTNHRKMAVSEAHLYHRMKHLCGLNPDPDFVGWPSCPVCSKNRVTVHILCSMMKPAVMNVSWLFSLGVAGSAEAYTKTDQT